MLTECFFHSQCFAGIIQRCTGSMGVDIIHICSSNASILDCHRHSTGCLCTIRKRSCNMIRITGATISDYFPIDFYISGKCMLQLLQNDNAGSLSHDKALTLCIKGNRSTLGITALMQCPHACKASHRDRCHSCLTSSGCHHILIAVTNTVKGFPNRIGCGCTGCHNTGNIAMCIHVDCGTAGCQIDQRHRYEIWRDTAWSTVFDRLGRTLDCRNTTNSRSDDNTEAITVELCLSQTTVLIGLLCRNSCELRETVIEF